VLYSAMRRQGPLGKNPYYGTEIKYFIRDYDPADSLVMSIEIRDEEGSLVRSFSSSSEYISKKIDLKQGYSSLRWGGDVEGFVPPKGVMTPRGSDGYIQSFNVTPGKYNVTFTYGDWIPNLFSITPQNPTVGGDLPGPGVTVYTDYFTIDGINLPITVDISAGQIQKEGEIAWASSLTVNSGDSIRARFTTPTTGGTANAGYDVVTDLVVRAGLIDDEPDDVVSATWQVTTRSPDIEPDPFGWSDSIENTPFNRIGIESETIVISDFEIPLEIEADYPIEVMINNDGIWRSVSEIT